MVEEEGAPGAFCICNIVSDVAAVVVVVVVLLFVCGFEILFLVYIDSSARSRSSKQRQQCRCDNETGSDGGMRG